eukprot:jgi/Mesvir1/16537/Mv10081-RA.1
MEAVLWCPAVVFAHSSAAGPKFRQRCHFSKKVDKLARGFIGSLERPRPFVRASKFQVLDVSQQSRHHEIKDEAASAVTAISDIKSLHFIGIGGAGLSALARVALAQGVRVTGSDAHDSPRLDELRACGATVRVGHSALNLAASQPMLMEAQGMGTLGVGTLPDAVVVTSAVRGANPELVAASALGIPVYKRNAWLGMATAGFDLLAVSGTHGKTSTSAMLAFVLEENLGGVTAVVGGDVGQFPGGGNAFMGQGKLFVLEADEYDGAFLQLRPFVAIVTNVELDHVDIYADQEAVQATFESFVGGVRPGGYLVCSENPGSKALHAKFSSTPPGHPGLWKLDTSTPRHVLLYGFGHDCDLRAVDVAPNPAGGVDYSLVYRGHPVGRVSLRLPGDHLVLNSMAVLLACACLAASGTHTNDNHSKGALNDNTSKGGAAGSQVAWPPNGMVTAASGSSGSMNSKDSASGGQTSAKVSGAVTLDHVRSAVNSFAGTLGTFQGVKRRFELIGEVPGCIIYDDYAHHPTEVRATLQALRQRFPGAPLWVVFQPHTYSRLQKFLPEFAECFEGAQKVIVSEVYASREKDSRGVCGKDLADAIQNVPVQFISQQDGILEYLGAQFGDATPASSAAKAVVVTLGAGDVTELGPKLLAKLLASK